MVPGERSVWGPAPADPRGPSSDVGALIWKVCSACVRSGRRTMAGNTKAQECPAWSSQGREHRPETRQLPPAAKMQMQSRPSVAMVTELAEGSAAEGARAPLPDARCLRTWDQKPHPQWAWEEKLAPSCPGCPDSHPKAPRSRDDPHLTQGYHRLLVHVCCTHGGPDAHPATCPVPTPTPSPDSATGPGGRPPPLLPRHARSPSQGPHTHGSQRPLLQISRV